MIQLLDIIKMSPFLWIGTNFNSKNKNNNNKANKSNNKNIIKKRISCPLISKNKLQTI